MLDSEPKNILIFLFIHLRQCMYNVLSSQISDTGAWVSINSFVRFCGSSANSQLHHSLGFIIPGFLTNVPPKYTATFRTAIGRNCGSRSASADLHTSERDGPCRRFGCASRP